MEKSKDQRNMYRQRRVKTKEICEDGEELRLEKYLKMEKSKDQRNMYRQRRVKRLEKYVKIEMSKDQRNI